ncbi:MAG TPA: trimethylamine methyltransferase family protein [Nocardioidaceae bacterium]|nr:trimethylamine methyltransferase family protein [Nocardioidaceae bacterium]
MTTDDAATAAGTAAGGGRAPRGRRRHRNEGPRGPAQPPWRQVRRLLEPVRAVSDDQLESIVDAAKRVLRETGVDFLHPRARELWAAAGADVDGDRVHLDGDLVEELVAHAPAELTLHARNPAHHVHLGGASVAFASVASAPYVSDAGHGRREGNRADFENLVRLSQSLNAVHLLGGYPVEPTDIHASVRHLHATQAMLTLTDKVPHAYSLGAQRNLDCLEMVRIARQVDDATLEREPSIHTIINASSPLRYDEPMLEGILQYSSRNQLVVITPFTLAGAMAPVTVAGALVQQHAEALAGIAFTQVVRPGSPVAYGGFTSNVDMRSGSPAFGTPEYMKAALVGGQLARRVGVPYRSSNVCAANAVDSQAGYESVFALWGAVMGGANLVMHAAGWLEGGLRASYEKLVIDADLLQMVSAFLDPIIVDDASLAVDAIAEVGPGGHFFGTQHTQDRFRDAFFAPMVSDWRNFESWEEAGSPTADTHAARLASELLDAYEQPSLSPDVAAELDDFVARRVAEGGVKTDF